MKIIPFLLFLFTSISFANTSPIKVMTWEGYITAQDISNINNILNQKKYLYHLEVIEPYASDPEQMYSFIRSGKTDMTFLTLFFIKKRYGKIAQYLQPINTQSPRLSEYPNLYPSLTHLEMGLKNNKPLYIPFGGGIYGLWKRGETGQSYSVNSLWQDNQLRPLALNSSQPWYNIGLTLMALGKTPFYLNDLIESNQRETAYQFANDILLPKLSKLYQSTHSFWQTSPSLAPPLNVVASWGPEVVAQNKVKNEWTKINFTEGDMVWLDTINFLRHLKGKKLEAAEVIANYFISKQAQDRVANALTMFPARKDSTTLNQLPITIDNFKSGMFVPPYNTVADNLVNSITKKALKMRHKL